MHGMRCLEDCVEKKKQKWMSGSFIQPQTWNSEKGISDLLVTLTGLNWTWWFLCGIHDVRWCISLFDIGINEVARKFENF